MKKLPLSQELFYDLYTKYSEKIEESQENIFSGINILPEMEKNYHKFTVSPAMNNFYAENSIYEKTKMIKEFIESDILSTLYSDVYDSLEKKSFKENYLLENTVQQFNVRYIGSNNQDELNLFEESLNTWLVGAAVGIGSMLGVIPAVAFAAGTILGLNLLMPSKFTRRIDDNLNTALGYVGTAAFGTQSILSKGKTSLSRSNNNIINFDNINTNPQVKTIFNKLIHSHNTSKPTEAINGINVMVESCLSQSKLDADLDDSTFKGMFRRAYSHQNNNVFTIAIQSIFKSGADKEDKEYASLLAYRRCLSEKLVDLYTFLIIANVSQSHEYKKIINVMKRGFPDNPSQLLAFVNETSDDNTVRDNILNLIKFRLYLEELSVELSKGAFDVDTEAGTFLKQKLKQSDTEIEDYFARNNKSLNAQFQGDIPEGTSYENQKEFNNRDFKNNPIPEKEQKRSLFGMNSTLG